MRNERYTIFMNARVHYMLASVFMVLCVPATASSFSPDAIARAVRMFFPTAPEMVEVARCESGLRQYTDSGRVLQGGLNNQMIGVFQLYGKIHREAALGMGYDINTLLGNLAYARELWRSQGTTPWRSSAHCWLGTEVAHADVGEAPITNTLTKTLRYGMRDPQVRVLQNLLRKAGYPTAQPGEETEYFDVATYKAVLAFQCEKNIACLTTPNNRVGVGVVGRVTRTALLSAE